MDVLITQEHLDAARAAGECGHAESYSIGDDASTVSQADLIWFEENVPVLARKASRESGVPLWAQAKSGSGDGSGDGFGSAFGSGDGFGFGFGSGFGDGYGSA